MAPPRADSGQASVELVAVVGVLLAVVACLAQLALVGYGLWSAGAAARSGARAAYVGGDAEAAALSALPGALAADARVADRGPVTVEVSVPSLLPGTGPIAVRAGAGLDPEGRADG